MEKEEIVWKLDPLFVTDKLTKKIGGSIISYIE